MYGIVVCENSPSHASVLASLSKLELNSVDTVDTVHEQDEDEDECYLVPLASLQLLLKTARHTFIPYCNFAMSGDSEMKVNILRLMVYGRGTMRPIKMDISVTKRRKT
jgi:hypothetical protein